MNNYYMTPMVTDLAVDCGMNIDKMSPIQEAGFANLLYVCIREVLIPGFGMETVINYISDPDCDSSLEWQVFAALRSRDTDAIIQLMAEDIRNCAIEPAELPQKVYSFLATSTDLPATVRNCLDMRRIELLSCGMDDRDLG